MPAAAREDILAELTDGLLEAVEANQWAGLERDRAIRDAAREFGSPEPLAAAFRADLMVVRGRRTALALLAVTPIVVGLWLGAARSRNTGGAVHLIDSPVDHIVTGVLITALLALSAWTLITTGRRSRWTSVRPGNSLLAAAVMAALVVIGGFAAAAGLTVRRAAFPKTFRTTALAAAVAATWASVLMAGRASCVVPGSNQSAEMSKPVEMPTTLAASAWPRAATEMPRSRRDRAARSRVI